MEAIQEPNEKFQFDKLNLMKPVNISGSNYFIKYVIKEYPLYIQIPKCKLKQCIQKGSKKLFCDLVFTNENESFIQWLENLEKHSCKVIYENREKWFDTELDEQDIEDMFLSPLKVYNSGKFYKVRVNIPTILGKSALKIYDENENLVDFDNIKEDDSVISILEVQGIKCSPKSFQIDLEMKQLLVLKPVDLFDKCILIKKTGSQQHPQQEISSTFPDVGEHLDEKENPQEHEIKVKKYEFETDKPGNQEEYGKEKEMENMESIENLESKENIQEIEISLEEIPQEEKVILKKRNDVYYEMYREALKKAKIAKELALASYLEAKRIKNTYMLKDVEDESDLENEDYETEE
jgi:Family of unknown function (DUF5871)